MRASLAVLPLGFVIGALPILSGCDSEQVTVEMHEPGVYKGAQDPLMDLAGTPEQSARLEERLRAVQTDR